MGKQPLRVLLARQGITLSVSMIGGMLASCRRRLLRREPHAVRMRTHRPPRPTDKRAPTEPGALVQLDTMHLRPFPGVERRQFMAGFETACQRRGIALYVLPPRSPTLNGGVERLNGTARWEFWGCYESDLDLPTLQQALAAWEVTYNTVRPIRHSGMRSPQPSLRSKKFSDVSN